jgi:paraquat-inducible protein B
MSGRASPRAIGLFVVAGIGLAIGAVAVFGSGQLFKDTHEFVSFFESEVGGLGPGSPVKYRGVTVGSVEGVYLRLASIPQEPTDNSIPVIYNLDANLLAGRGAALDLDNPASIDSLIEMGITARLSTESLVTGRQYVDLDMLPDRERRYVVTSPSDLVEIPTVRTGLEEIQQELQDVISDISELDLPGLFEDVRRVVVSVREQVDQGDIGDLGNRLATTMEGFDETLAAVRTLVASADSTLGPVAANLDESVATIRGAADQFEGTLEAVQGTIEPEGRLAYRLDIVLRDLAEAARSFRNLADFLERNPAALVRGRPDNQE